MRAWAVVENEKPLQEIELPTPEPVGTEVLLETTYCGVCHSDLHIWEGRYDLGGGKVMTLRVSSPEDGVFEIVPTQPAKPQRQNEGTRKIVVRLPAISLSQMISYPASQPRAFHSLRNRIERLVVPRCPL